MHAHTHEQLNKLTARTKESYLDERVDGHDGQLGLSLGIVHQVQIHQLLQLQIIRLNAVDDIGK